MYLSRISIIVSVSNHVFFHLDRAHLRALSYGGLHLRGVRGCRISGGCVLLHLPATQTAHPAADPLLAAQSGGNHSHDPNHSSAQPPDTIPAVQHGHHQLQLSGGRELPPSLLSGPGRRAVFSTAAALGGLIFLIVDSSVSGSNPAPAPAAPTSLHHPTGHAGQ